MKFLNSCFPSCCFLYRIRYVTYCSVSCLKECQMCHYSAHSWLGNSQPVPLSHWNVPMATNGYKQKGLECAKKCCLVFFWSHSKIRVFSLWQRSTKIVLAKGIRAFITLSKEVPSRLRHSICKVCQITQGTILINLWCDFTLQFICHLSAASCEGSVRKSSTYTYIIRYKNNLIKHILCVESVHVFGW